MRSLLRRFRLALLSALLRHLGFPGLAGSLWRCLGGLGSPRLKDAVVDRGGIVQIVQADEQPIVAGEVDTIRGLIAEGEHEIARTLVERKLRAAGAVEDHQTTAAVCGINEF